MKNNIIIIHYDMGNVGSIKNMFKRLGYSSKISSNPKIISMATHLVLPGVGSFDNGMSKLIKNNLVNLLKKKVKIDKVPILGICLGMQLMTNCSEEGKMNGLGWIDAETCRFRFNNSKRYAGLKVPHMGWNEVKPKDGELLYQGYSELPKYYFVHSYHVCCKNSEHCIGTTIHGYDFTASIRSDNIMGVQFHPEKSHRFGMKLLSNFVSINTSAGIKYTSTV